MYTSTKAEMIHCQQICMRRNVKGNSSGRRGRPRGRKKRLRGREEATEGQMEDLRRETKKEFICSKLMFTSLM